jgi:hypothetical protein
MITQTLQNRSIFALDLSTCINQWAVWHNWDKIGYRFKGSNPISGHLSFFSTSRLSTLLLAMILETCNDTGNMQWYRKHARILETFNDTGNMQWYWKHAMILETCNDTGNMQWYWKHAMILQTCNDTANMQWYCKLSMILETCNDTGNMQWCWKHANASLLNYSVLFSRSAKFGWYEDYCEVP